METEFRDQSQQLQQAEVQTIDSNQTTTSIGNNQIISELVI